jgi:hypothetical protein
MYSTFGIHASIFIYSRIWLSLLKSPLFFAMMDNETTITEPKRENILSY